MISLTSLFEFEQIDYPEKLLDLMKDIKYDNNANEDTYIVKTPKELLKTKSGICYDQVELEREYLTKHNYEFKTFFIYPWKNEKRLIPTHTFLIFKENNKYYWFEYSWESYRGISNPFDSYESACNYVQSQLSKLSKYNDYKVIEYTAPKIKHLTINQWARYVVDHPVI